MLLIEDLHTSYGGIEALRGLELEVKPGEIVSLIGCNGAGKSTTLRTISGLIRPWRGRITLEGVDLTRRRPDEIVGLGLVHCPEGRRIFSGLTVAENLALGAYLRRDHAEVRKDRDLVFALFPRLAERLAQLGGTLSGGEQQMLAIGRALASRPRLLMLDEPSLGIAPILAAEIFAAIRALRDERGMTILLVEQNARAALRLADRGYVLETGCIAACGAAAALSCDARVAAAYLGGSQTDGHP